MEFASDDHGPLYPVGATLFSLNLTADQRKAIADFYVSRRRAAKVEVDTASRVLVSMAKQLADERQRLTDAESRIRECDDILSALGWESVA